MSRVEFSSTALIKAPLGVKPSAATFAPEGWNPSTKYWRTSAPAAAALGQAMLVPVIDAVEHAAVPAETIEHPGVNSSGFRLPSLVGPVPPEHLVSAEAPFREAPTAS